MLQLFQEFILSQWLILTAYLIIFIFLSRWALVNRKQYAGYGLGWFLAVFFILVYSSVGGMDLNPTTTVETTPSLNGFQVISTTLFGLIIGSLMLIGLRFGMRDARAVSLQIALYIGLILILMFLVVVEGPIGERMIGIFGMAIGIVTLFAFVLFPMQEQQDLNIQAPGGTQGTQPLNAQGNGGGAPVPSSRLDQIRNNINDKNRQRR